MPDHLMVFRSKDDLASSQVSKRMPRKATRARAKQRKDTPVPPTKGEGRKRFDVSPLREDKKICKWLDFCSGSNHNFAALELGETNPPENLQVGSKGSSKNMGLEAEDDPKVVNQDMRMVCYNPLNGEDNSPESGLTACVGEAAGSGEDNLSHKPWSKLEGLTNSNGVLGGGIVNLPKMNLETNLLLESSLEAFHLGGSHGNLAVGDHMEPKNDNILLLARIDSAETLDTLVAQPLLASDRPEEAQMVISHGLSLPRQLRPSCRATRH